MRSLKAGLSLALFTSLLITSVAQATIPVAESDEWKAAEISLVQRDRQKQSNKPQQPSIPLYSAREDAQAQTIGHKFSGANSVLEAEADINIISPSQPIISEDSLPSQSLILGVPFVSLSEAKQLEYTRKDIVNPSIAATKAMVLQYWGRSLELLQGKTWDWAIKESKDAASLDELKPWIDQQIPVIVGTVGITPVAHTLYGNARIHAITGQIPESWVQPHGPISGMLGTMVPLKVFQQIQDAGIDFNYVRESVTGITRVVVGYDDTRRVVTLHDASFGPGWEVSYEDFDRMWAAGGRHYLVVYPADYRDSLAKKQNAPAYPHRTAEQRAAEAYVMGYGLSAAGHHSAAEARFREGLAIPGLSQGMRHLLQLDLAETMLCCGDDAEAGLAALDEAIALLPENSAPWFFMASLYEQAGRPERARTAAKRAEQLCNSEEANETLRRVLPKNLFLQSCHGGYF